MFKIILIAFAVSEKKVMFTVSVKPLCLCEQFSRMHVLKLHLTDFHGIFGR